MPPGAPRPVAPFSIKSKTPVYIWYISQRKGIYVCIEREREIEIFIYIYIYTIRVCICLNKMHMYISYGTKICKPVDKNFC